MAEKVDLNRILRALDNKDRAFYDSLSLEEQKGLSLFLMLRYASSTEAYADLDAYYLSATNVFANKDFFTISKHPKLQWLCLTAVSPGLGNQRHKWISLKKKDAGDKKGAEKRRFLSSIYPTYKDDDIDILMTINTDDQIKEYRKNLGGDS